MSFIKRLFGFGEHKETWQEKIDRLNEEEREKERIKKEEKERQAKESAERRKKERLANHQAKFKCCVCGKPSSGPTKKTTHDHDGPGSSYYDWDDPAGLRKCSVCGRWACNNHWYSGYCKNCGEKL